MVRVPSLSSVHVRFVPQVPESTISAAVANVGRSASSIAMQSTIENAFFIRFVLSVIEYLYCSIQKKAMQPLGNQIADSGNEMIFCVKNSGRILCSLHKCVFCWDFIFQSDCIIFHIRLLRHHGYIIADRKRPPGKTGGLCAAGGIRRFAGSGHIYAVPRGASGTPPPMT